MQPHDYKTEKWDFFEIVLNGPDDGNPFLDVTLSAEFKLKDNVYKPAGFYDGNGIYKIRFMPDTIGVWSYTTKSNVASLNEISGTFTCTKPSSGNHGPVGIHNQYYFSYADGTPYFPIGTTCYVWNHQGDALEKQTLDTLKHAPFNKIRMCVFPKSYTRNQNEPERYPFEGDPPATWDFTRFNPDFFDHLEKNIQALMELKIEADLILFHPYDQGHWGFDRMDSETDDRYLRYIIARLSAFRNIWWSLANEYDYMAEKTGEDWERFFQIVLETDSYNHLRSIHNGTVFYDHWKPHITHASIQFHNPIEGVRKHGFGRYRLFRDIYKKATILDEIEYEGNLEKRWGCLPAEEMLHRFWISVVSGTYFTHGETFDVPDQILWWAKGGKLHGQSPARIAFLKEIIEKSPMHDLEPIDKWWQLNVIAKGGEYYLYYFGCDRWTEWKFALPSMNFEIPIGSKFQVEVIDTWNMTITPVKKLYEVTDKELYCYTSKHNPIVTLPGKEYIALRIQRVSES